MNDDSIRDRVTRQGEEALGRLAQELLDNPIVSGALTAAFDTRERAMRAQEVAMGALNLPSAADLERLTRRVRSVSQRLEGIEDGLDRIDDRMTRGSSGGDLEDRLTRIEAVLERLEATRAEQTAAAVAAAEVAAVEAVVAEDAAEEAAAQAARASARKPASKTSAKKPASGGSSRSSARKPAAKRSSGQRRSS